MNRPTMDELRDARDSAASAARGHKRDTEGLSRDQRRTMQNQRIIDSGHHPATRRPLLAVDEHAQHGSTCGDCVHAQRVHNTAQAHWKCDMHRLGMSRSEASDIRVGWPACVIFEPGPEPEGDGTP